MSIHYRRVHSKCPNQSFSCLHPGRNRSWHLCLVNERAWKIPCLGHPHLGWQPLFFPPLCHVFLWWMRWCREPLLCGKAIRRQVCPLMWAACIGYEIECERRATDAQSVIHPGMGRRHSNLCEAAFSILPQFRAKNLALHRLSYITLTNWRLIMSCVDSTDD